MLANKTITTILNGLPNDLDKETLEYRINEQLNNQKSMFDKNYKLKSRERADESVSIARDDRLSYEEKMFYTSRIKEGILRATETLDNKLKFLDDLSKYTQKALEAGAYSKAEIANIVIKLSEVNNTKDRESKRLLIDSLNNFYRQKLEEGGVEKAGKLVKSNPLFGKFESDSSSFMWSSDGFTNVMAVAMILMFILGVGVGIAMMLLGL